MSCLDRYFGATLGLHLVKLYQMVFREKNSYSGNHLPKYLFVFKKTFAALWSHGSHLVKLHQMSSGEKNSHSGNVSERKWYSVRFVWNSAKKYCQFTLRKLGTVVDHVTLRQTFRSGTRFTFGETLPNGIWRNK